MKNIIILLGCFSILLGCDGDSDPQGSVTKPAITSQPADGAERVSVLTEIKVTLEQDLSGFSAADDIIVVKSVAYLPSDGYIHNVTYSEHNKIIQSISCINCHFSDDVLDEILSPRLWPLLTKQQAKPKVISGTSVLSGNTVTFKPDIPLEYATQYEISINSSLDNNALTPTIYRFKTFENPQLKRTKYVDGAIVEYTNLLYGSNVDMVYNITYNDPGNDLIWGDPQDTISGYVKDILGSNGRLKQTIKYSDAGSDGDWIQSGDNGIDFYINYTFGDKSELLRYSLYKAGPDNQISENDIVQQYTDFRYDLDGNLLAVLEFMGPGANGAWFDDDDSLGVKGWYSKLVIVNPSLRRFVRYNGNGINNKWYTEDDVVESYRAQVTDQYGRPTESTVYSDAGPRGVWFDEDDTVNTKSTFGYSLKGKLESIIRTDVDGLVVSGSILAYDSLGRLEKYHIYSDSVEKIVNSTDYAFDGSTGLLVSEIDKSFDQMGNPTSAGQTKFSYDSITGNTLKSVQLDAGPDLDPLLEDDNIIKKTITYDNKR